MVSPSSLHKFLIRLPWWQCWAIYFWMKLMWPKSERQILLYFPCFSSLNNIFFRPSHTSTYNEFILCNSIPLYGWTIIYFTSSLPINYLLTSSLFVISNNAAVGISENIRKPLIQVSFKKWAQSFRKRHFLFTVWKYFIFAIL